MKTLLLVAAALAALSLPGCAPGPPHPEATMYRRAGDHAEELQDGALVGAGDRLRPCVQGGWGHATLLGEDGTGVVQIYGSWRLAPGEQRCAPFALELDAAPGPERFWLVAGPGADRHVPVQRPEGSPGWRFEKR